MRHIFLCENDIYERTLIKENRADYDLGIYNGYTYMLNALKDNIKIEEIEKFCEFLLNNVYILRIEVPEHTDLNHYFEIMNTRGEQLESHEYIKAYLMKQLPKTEHDKFKYIWEKCSDMDKYIQLSFSDLKTRKQIFGDSWKIFKADDYDSIAIGIDNNDLPQSIADIINDTPEDFFLEADGEEYESEEDKKNKEHKPFSSIINFSNFLLIVLKIQVNNDVLFKGNKNTSLGDKDLIDAFREDDYFECHPKEQV